MKNKRATIAAIAAHAGVSPSTVDRVLNARLPVRGKTAERVLQAAQDLHYHGVNLLSQRINESLPNITLGLVLQSTSSPFARDLIDRIRNYAARNRPECRNILIEETGDVTPQAMATALRQHAARVDAVGVMLLDHPTVNEAVNILATEGTPIVAVLSGLSSPYAAGYVGIDHQKAGRTAGWFLSRALNRSGKIGILIESYQYRALQEREIGLRNYILEHEPDMQLCEGVYGIASNSIVERMYEELLARHPDLKGLYFVGAGVSAVLTASKHIRPDRRPLIVCHELTDATRTALGRGEVEIVLDSCRDELAKEIVERLVEVVTSPDNGRRVRHVEFRMYCKENI